MSARTDLDPALLSLALGLQEPPQRSIVEIERIVSAARKASPEGDPVVELLDLTIEMFVGVVVELDRVKRTFDAELAKLRLQLQVGDE